jgi:hypothetical protein
MNCNFKPLFLLLVLALFVISGLSAQKPDFARPGPKGVYLFLGKNIPCGKPIASYRIERKAVNGSWQFVADVTAPSTFSELIKRIEEAKNSMPSQPLPSEARMQKLFIRAIQTGTTDSLKGSGLQYPVKLGLGVMYYDAAAPTGPGIQYKVTELTKTGQEQNEMISDTLTLPYVASFDEMELAESSRTEKMVYIKWRSTGNNPGPLYMVHKMDNKTPVLVSGSGGHYSVNDTTYYVFQDSLTVSQSTQELQYFITPFDQLGNAGKSSQVVAITNDNFNKAFFINVLATKIPNILGIRISWHFSDPVTINSIDLYRSEFKDQGFMKLSSFNRVDTSYIDSIISPEKSYYYYLQAYSRSGKRFKQSNPVFVLAYQPVKPGAPVIVEASGTNKGVRLLINANNSNCDGVRVFRSDGMRDQLMAISDLILKRDSSLIEYLDSSPGLSGRYHYIYAARCEGKGTVASDLSNKMSAQPLVSSAPPSPVFLKAFIDNNTIRLFWENMQQSDSGIAGYIVSRRAESATSSLSLPFSPIAGEKQPYVPSFMFDSSVVKGNVYSYIVQSIDNEKLRSIKKKFARVSLMEDFPIAPVGLTLENRIEGVKIEWGQALYQGIQSYKLYRHEQGQAPDLIGTLPPATSDFIDNTAKAGHNYFYFLTTLNQKGKESDHSEEIEISH